MIDPAWDGVARAETLSPQAPAARHQLANAAKAYEWQSVLALLAEHNELINSTRPGGSSLYTVLHQAAHGGAPAEIVEQLLTIGAWRTLRTAHGDRPIDIAERRGHAHLRKPLEPALKHDVPLDMLQLIQQHFHAVIRERADQFLRDHALRLPELEPLLEMVEPKLWFAIPGMYGGFHFWLDQIAGEPVLMTESWCRVEDGSGQRHVISPFGNLLIAEGFV